MDGFSQQNTTISYFYMTNHHNSQNYFHLKKFPVIFLLSKNA